MQPPSQVPTHSEDPQLKDRLNQIAEKITSPEFLSGQGLGNEIGFWIFDYPPEHELQVREYLTFLKPASFMRALIEWREGPCCRHRFSGAAFAT